MKMKNIEVEVLERIYENLLMIKETIVRVIKIQDIDKELNICLKDILNLYQRLIYSVIGMIKNRNKNKGEKDIGLANKMATYMSVKINLKKCDNINQVLNIVKQDILIRNEEIKDIIKEYTKISKTIINLCDRIDSVNKKCIETIERGMCIKREYH